MDRSAGGKSALFVFFASLADPAWFERYLRDKGFRFTSQLLSGMTHRKVFVAAAADYPSIAPEDHYRPYLIKEGGSPYLVFFTGFGNTPTSGLEQFFASYNIPFESIFNCRQHNVSALQVTREAADLIQHYFNGPVPFNSFMVTIHDHVDLTSVMHLLMQANPTENAVMNREAAQYQPLGHQPPYYGQIPPQYINAKDHNYYQNSPAKIASAVPAYNTPVHNQHGYIAQPPTVQPYSPGNHFTEAYLQRPPAPALAPAPAPAPAAYPAVGAPAHTFQPHQTTPAPPVPLTYNQPYEYPNPVVFNPNLVQPNPQFSSNHNMDLSGSPATQKPSAPVKTHSYISVEAVESSNYEKVVEEIKKMVGYSTDLKDLGGKRLRRAIFAIPLSFYEDKFKERESLTLAGTEYSVILLERTNRRSYIFPHIGKENMSREATLFAERLEKQVAGCSVEILKELGIITIQSDKDPAEGAGSMVYSGTNRIDVFEAYPIRVLAQLPESTTVRPRFENTITSICEALTCVKLTPRIYGIYFKTLEEAKERLKEEIKVTGESSFRMKTFPDCLSLILDGVTSNINEVDIEKVCDKATGSFVKLIDIDYDKSMATLFFDSIFDYEKALGSKSLRIKDQTLIISDVKPIKFALNNIPYRYQRDHKLLEQDLRNSKFLKDVPFSLKEISERYILSVYSREKADDIGKVSGILMPDGSFVSVVDPSVPVDSPEFDAGWYDRITDVESVDQYMNREEIFRRKWNQMEWSRKFAIFNEQYQKGRNQSEKETAFAKLKGLRITAMLNTIGVCRLGRYTTASGKQVSIGEPPESMTYDHTPDLPTSVRWNDRPVKVEVINKDCLEIARELSSEKKRPLVLNMTSAKRPGGGYRRGEVSQEEIMFRRSNYYMTLDDLDIGNTKHKKRPNYPLKDFGAAYSPEVTVFRKGEEDSYEFLEEPFLVDFVAVAPMKSPSVTNEKEKREFIIKTSQKIKTMLAVAVANRHDIIILSAFGCGAYGNPPKLVAKIFRECLKLYGGYFSRVIFSVIDDHNSFRRGNTDGNHKVFIDEFSSGKIEPIRCDLSYSRLTPCNYGIECSDKDPQHLQRFFHPLVCHYKEKCRDIGDNDDTIVHWESWIHKSECKFRGLCKEWADPKHAKLFSHPAECHLKENCSNTEKSHMESLLHLPECPEGHKCKQISNAQHKMMFRHFKKKCEHGTFCPMYNDTEHCDDLEHPFLPVCKAGFGECSISDPKHKEAHSHVCSWGQSCRDINHPAHLRQFVHVVRAKCGSSRSCERITDDEHCMLYSHEGMQDIRKYCDRGESCKDRCEPRHYFEYYHKRRLYPVCHSNMLNVDVPFRENMKHGEKNIKSHVKPINKIIYDWFTKLKPVHRCSVEIFQSVVLHGMVMSLETMNKLQNPEYVSKEVKNHPFVRKVTSKKPKENSKVALERKRVVDEFVEHRVTMCISEVSYGGGGENQGILQGNKEKLKTLKKNCNDNGVSVADLDKLEKISVDIGKACHHLHANQKGIKYEVDIKMGTNQHVFSILGPHTGAYYGAISLVFKQDILYHPDTNTTPAAGTAFHSGRVIDGRSWISNTPGKERELFDRFKVHAAEPGWNERLADEVVSFLRNKGHKCDDVNSLKSAWEAVDSHFITECHLPPLIPISYVHKIIMPKDIWTKIDQETKTRLNEIFTDFEKEILVITPTEQGADEKKITNASWEVERKGAEFFDQPCGLTGFSFSTEPDNPPTAIPGLFRKAGSGHLYFRAMGSKFFVYLCSGADKRNIESGSVLTIYIKNGAKGGGVYIFDKYVSSPKGPIASGAFRAHSMGFNDNLDPSNLIEYHIEMTGNEVIVKHFGPSHIYNRKRLTYRASSSMDFRYVAFGSDSFPTNYVDVRVLEEPISEPRITLPAPASSGTTGGSISTLRNTSPTPSPTIQHQKSVQDTNQGGGGGGGGGGFIKMVVGIFSGGQGGNTSQNSPPRQAGRSPSSPPRRRSSSPNPDDCPNEATCLEFHIESHRKRLNHPIAPVCPDGPKCRNAYNNNPHHQGQFSHPCRFGVGCRDFQTGNLTHNSSFYHIPLPSCSDGSRCGLFGDVAHRVAYNHAGWPDIMIPCRDGLRCPMKGERKHAITYSHQ